MAIPWGTIISVGGSLLSGLFKKKDKSQNTEVSTEEGVKSGGSLMDKLGDILGGVVSGAGAGSSGGWLTTLAGGLLGGIFGNKKSGKEGNNGFVSSLSDNPFLTGGIGLVSAIVKLLKNNQDKKDDVKNVDNGNNVDLLVENAKLKKQIAEMNNPSGPVQPGWGQFNTGYPPTPYVIAPPPSRPVAFHRPPVHNRPPVFRTARMPRGHAVTRIMPNNFGRMV